MKNGPKKSGQRWLFSLHHIVLAVSLITLLLPLGSLHFLKLYESALVRQTESELISQSAFIAAAYKKEVSDLLAQQHRQFSQYGRPLPREKMCDNDYYQPIPETLDLAKDPVLPSRPDGQRRKPADPVAAAAGQKIGPILKDAQRITLSGMKVLDFQGVTVGGQQELGLSFAHLPEVHMALRGKPDSLLRKRGGLGLPPSPKSISRGSDINVYVSVPIIAQNRVIGAVLVNRTPSDLIRLLYSKRGDLTSAVIVVLLVTLAIAAVTSHTITRPIEALIRQARRIARGEPNAAAPLRNPMTREIATLSENLSAMAETIEHRSNYIRQFAMHVSHEFKTPLTAIQGGLELLQEHGDTMPVEQRARFLGNMAQDTDRLKRLVNRLLELARADMLQPGAEQVPVLPLLEYMAARYRDSGLRTTIENHTGLANPQAAISTDALESVLTHLLGNSAQHGASEIAITLQTQENMLALQLVDNGCGISQANTGQLFTPFFTTRREKGGTGLGLSIARALLSAHKGGIELVPSPQGACFVLLIPCTAPNVVAENTKRS